MPDDPEVHLADDGYHVHESAYVDEGAVVGEGTRIWHFCHVMPEASIGRNCTLGQNVVVMPRVRLGSNVKVQNNVSLYEGVVCEDDVFLGPSMVFTNVINPRSHVPRKDEFRETHVGKGASIGANATILCGLRLGAYCFVAAGAVVTKEVAPHALVAGVPARRVGWMCVCGVRLDDEEPPERELACAECGRRYARVEDGGLVLARDADDAEEREA